MGPEWLVEGSGSGMRSMLLPRMKCILQQAQDSEVMLETILEFHYERSLSEDMRSLVPAAVLPEFNASLCVLLVVGPPARCFGSKILLPHREKQENSRAHFIQLL